MNTILFFDNLVETSCKIPGTSVPMSFRVVRSCESNPDGAYSKPSGLIKHSTDEVRRRSFLRLRSDSILARFIFLNRTKLGWRLAVSINNVSRL